MIERLNNAENMWSVVLIALGVGVCMFASHWHDGSLSQVGTGIVGAGCIAFKGRSSSAN